MLTAIQLAALRSVSDPKRLPHPAASHAQGNTLRSLERKGLVEHTSLGWRLTNEGAEALNARAKESK